MARWRNNPDLVEDTRKLFASDYGQKLLAVLHAEIPRGYAHAPGQQLGRMNGFMEAISLLESMAEVAPEPEKELQPTWGAEEENAENQQ